MVQRLSLQNNFMVPHLRGAFTSIEKRRYNVHKMFTNCEKRHFSSYNNLAILALSFAVFSETIVKIGITLEPLEII